MADPYLSKGEARGLVYGLLVAFAAIAGLAIPFAARELKRRGVTAKSDEGADFWFSARNSQDWPMISLSICATGAGSWLLYTPAEAAYLGGWWGIFGYTLAMLLGPLVMCVLAPMFRQQVPDSGNVTDWVGDRFGPIVQGYVTLVLIYYMFIYLVGQLKSMGDMMTMFSELKAEEGLIPVAIVTVLYTMLGGLPASIVTDQIQAICIIVFVVVISIALFAWVEVTDENWDQVSVWTDRGFEMGVSLCFAVFSAEVFNLAFWQRIYAARDVKQLRIGFVVGAGLVSVLTFLFGVVGLLLKAQDLANQVSTIPYPAATFFQILSMSETTKGMRVLIFVLATCMIASCADSFQTGITSVISRTVRRKGLGPKRTLAIGEIFVIVINICAIAFAVEAVNDYDRADGLGVKLTDLFSMADILTVTLVMPLFSGLWPFVTTKGTLAGLWSGLLTIMIWGFAEFGYFMAGLEMLTLMCFGNTEVQSSEDGAPACGFYSRRAVMMFPSLPLITGVVTFAVSWMDRVWQVLYELSPTKLQTLGSGEETEKLAAAVAPAPPEEKSRIGKPMDAPEESAMPEAGLASM